MAVVKLARPFVEIPQSEMAKLREKLKALKKERRGLKTRLTHLQNRSSDLIVHLDDYIVPKQKTVRKKQLLEAMQPVRNLVE